MKEVLTKHLLAGVLLFVLVWYTTVVPAPARPPAYRPKGEPPDDAEERDAVPNVVAGRGRADERHGGYAPSYEQSESVDDMDWPDVIGG